MKTLIISDIHGSYKRLTDVLNTPYHYDTVILVGDNLYHGPRNPILEDYNPAKVSELLNNITTPILAVRGNCDAEVDQMLCDFNIMQDYTIFNHNNKTIYITHGHLLEPKDAAKTNADIFISGHTHIPGFKMVENVLTFNPGSIALPKDGHPGTYGYMDDTTLTIYTLDHKVYDQHKI